MQKVSLPLGLDDMGNFKAHNGNYPELGAPRDPPKVDKLCLPFDASPTGLCKLTLLAKTSGLSVKALPR